MVHKLECACDLALSIYIYIYIYPYISINIYPPSPATSLISAVDPPTERKALTIVFDERELERESEIETIIEKGLCFSL